MDPVYIANENTVENCTLKFSKVLEKMVHLKRITSKIGHDATEQFMKLMSEVVRKCKDKFREINKYEHRLDTFFFTVFTREMLWFTLEGLFLIFCLFHGQAVIERGFKTSNDCSVINQSRESLIASGIVKDHWNAKNVTAANIPITRNMISNVKAARARYFEEMEQKTKVENQRKVNLKRKIVWDEITDVQKKKARLQESINDLIKDAGKLAFETET